MNSAPIKVYDELVDETLGNEELGFTQDTLNS